jgi:leucine-rich repeat protein SHOC2
MISNCNNEFRRGLFTKWIFDGCEERSDIQILELDGNDRKECRILIENFNKLNWLDNISKLANGLIYVNLSYCYLNFLTPEIGKLTHLKTLIVKANFLTKLPSEIGNLINLEVLKLSHNLLTELPFEFANLSNLKVLNLSHNKLTQLPEIANLSNLEVLNLSHNKLTQLPEIANLIKLKKLRCSYNFLLTVSINNLIELIEFDFSFNMLNELPSGINNLINLKAFYVIGNKFSLPIIY